MTDWSDIDDRLLDPMWYKTGEIHETFRQLRDEDPVHWTHDRNYGKDYWALTRYDDVKEYLNSPDKFSSRWDTRVPRTPKRRTPEERHAQGWDVQVATNDDPMHDLYRRPMNKHFALPAMSRLSHQVDQIVDEVLDEIAERGECELVEDVAARVPAMVVLRMLGVPPEDWDYLAEASWQFLSAADPRYMIDDDEVTTSLTGHKKLLDYCADLAMQRRKDPRDDFATIIGKMEVDGDLLSIHELKVWFTTMIAGGLDTTRNAIAVGTLLFLENPDQARLLLDDPGVAKGAVEEVLRAASPAKTRLRVATRDFDFGGQRVRSGDWVVGFQISANRDERQFTEPERFDITRTPNDHLSFGSGVHLCLGRFLARLELATFFPRLLERFPDLEVVDDDRDWIADRGSHGLNTLRVRYTPSARSSTLIGSAS